MGPMGWTRLLNTVELVIPRISRGNSLEEITKKDFLNNVIKGEDDEKNQFSNMDRTSGTTCRNVEVRPAHQAYQIQF